MDWSPSYEDTNLIGILILHYLNSALYVSPREHLRSPKVSQGKAFAYIRHHKWNVKWSMNQRMGWPQIGKHIINLELQWTIQLIIIKMIWKFCVSHFSTIVIFSLFLACVNLISMLPEIVSSRSQLNGCVYDDLYNHK